MKFVELSYPLAICFWVNNWGLILSRNNSNEINVGVLMISQHGAPFDMERVGPAIHMALDEVNNSLYQTYNYTLLATEKYFGPLCDISTAPGLASELYYEQNISALIGVGCSVALDVVARLANYWNIPILTGLGESGNFIDKDIYKTLTRNSYCQCALTEVLDAIFRQFNWTDCVIITADDHPFFAELGKSIRNGLQKQSAIYAHASSYYNSRGHTIAVLLEDGAVHARIFVLCVPGEVVREILLTAYRMGYSTTGEFVFLNIELFNDSYWGYSAWEATDVNHPFAIVAYESLISVSLHHASGGGFEKFAEEVRRTTSREYKLNYRQNKAASYFAESFYDVIRLYGIGLVEAIQDEFDLRDGYNFTRNFLWNRTIQGIMDEDVFINSNGDREVTFSILDLNPTSGEMEEVACFSRERGLIFRQHKKFHWAGNRTHPPLNIPLCGLKHDNPSCANSASTSTAIVGLIIVFVVSLAGTALSLLIYRKRKTERYLHDMSWLIPDTDLQAVKSADLGSYASSISILSKPLPSQLKPTLSLYNGRVAAVRLIEHNRRINITRAVLMEVKMRRELLQENISHFVGIVMNEEIVNILVDYYPKGSLQDLLDTETVPLDQVFKMSLLGDIVQGLFYIHSSNIRVHGRLSSSNCLIDSRFVVKLTDFGLTTFYNTDTLITDVFTSENEKGLWIAPEHLRMTKYRGSQKGDVYSLGIIIQEIVLRTRPYPQERSTYTIADIMDKVKEVLRPEFRPHVPSTACRSELYQLMLGCWSELPGERPDVGYVQRYLKKMNKGGVTSLLDNLMNRMQQYANNLEVLVEDRTKQLVVEKARTEQLLLQILPVTIADQLKAGYNVDPEWFDCVTIYFSDIVGFTEMCAQSTVFEVVAFLNDLYTCFDDIVGQFDVYKVETIGDSYMVVSGLPVRNGDQHAMEIASMSLSLLNAVYTFHIEHRPQDQLKLRIGVHSGSCAAGVVGLKMPRYCLFGDTVNTASRMESTGKAQCIQVSPQTKELLDKFGTCDLVERGPVELKGKGVITTYWLVGAKPA